MAHPFQTVVYIQIRRRWISIRVMSWSGGDSRWEGEPRMLALRTAKGKERIVLPEEFPDATVPRREFCLFSHPRVVVDQLDDTIVGLGILVKRAKLKRAPAKPTFVFHLRESWEGGISDIERQAFEHIGKACGAGRVLISEQSNELAAPEVLALAKTKSPS